MTDATAANVQGLSGDPSTLITKKKKKSLTLLLEMPRLKREFAAFLMSQEDRKYLLPKARA